MIEVTEQLILESQRGGSFALILEMAGMRRGIDFEKMEAAFKRAAHKAIHGTREERSGRFLPRQEVSSTSDANRDASKVTDSTERKA